MPRPDPQRLRDLFDDALDLPPERRREFVRAAAADDPDLVAEVLDLLDALDDVHAHGEFLEPKHGRDADHGPIGGLLADAWGRSDVRSQDLPDLGGQIVGERYRLLEQLGHGGFGVVYGGTDLATQDDVAVKLTRPGPQGIRVASRELAALLLLGDPGVVRWLDDGTHEGVQYFVAERIHGRPFPGSDRPAPWSAVAPVVDRLLATLSRVHALGLVHGDLKPPNVLVEHGGRVVLLDFGLARGRVLDHATDRAVRAGTRAYMAPELLSDALVEAGPGADLYAVALMTVQAVTGDVPHATEGTDPEQLVRRRVSEPFDPVVLEGRGLPDEAVATLTRMLDLDPAKRPQTALDARSGLRAADTTDRDFEAFLAAGVRPAASAGRALTDAEVRALFAGPDRILHLREDAAALVLRRTAGEPGAVAAEITRWSDEGYARFEDGLVRVQRSDLDRLDLVAAMESGSGPEAEVLAALERGDVEDATRRALVLARELDSTGFAGRALALLTTTLQPLREREDVVALEAELLVGLLDLALSLSEVREIEIVRAHLERGRGAEAVHLAALGRAALMAARGDKRRALAAVEAAGQGERPEVTSIWQTIRGFASRQFPDGERVRVVREIERWAAASTAPTVRRLALAERAWLRYWLGDFRGAADLHARAAELPCGPRLRANSLTSAAEAARWAVDLEAAWDLVERVSPILAAARLPSYEVRLAAVARAVAYCEGKALAVDRELVAAVAIIDDPGSAAYVLLTEAAVAWRLGDLESARRLAVDWARTWADPDSVGACLGRALAAAAGEPTSAHDVRHDADRAAAAYPPGLGLQTLALLACAGLDVTDEDRSAARSLAAALPECTWTRRREILSPREALDMLNA